MKAGSIVSVLFYLFVASHGAAVPPSSPSVVSYPPTSKGSSDVTHTTFPAPTVKQTGARVAYETARWTNESSAQEEGVVFTLANSLRAEGVEGGLLPATRAEVAAITAVGRSSDVLPAFESSGGGAASTDFGTLDGKGLVAVGAMQTVDDRSLTETTIAIANIASSFAAAAAGDKLVLNAGTYSAALLTLNKSITITCVDITTPSACTLDGNSEHQVLKLSATTTVNVEYMTITNGYVSSVLASSCCMRCLQNCLL